MSGHTAYECPTGCNQWGCIYCDGGLFSCTVCDAAEGELTTECPRKPVPNWLRKLVYNYKGVDFIDGAWSIKPPEEC